MTEPEQLSGKKRADVPGTTRDYGAQRSHCRDSDNPSIASI